MSLLTDGNKGNIQHEGYTSTVMGPERLHEEVRELVKTC